MFKLILQKLYLKHTDSTVLFFMSKHLKLWVVLYYLFLTAHLKFALRISSEWFYLAMSSRVLKKLSNVNVDADSLEKTEVEKQHSKPKRSVFSLVSLC